MWSAATREKYSRKAARYQSDVTDKEWSVIEELLPVPKARGRPRGWPLREIVNAIFYVMRSGCPWRGLFPQGPEPGRLLPHRSRARKCPRRLLPSDFPPWSTVYRWFSAWRDASVFEKLNHALVMADRERCGREASPSAAVIDSHPSTSTG